MRQHAFEFEPGVGFSRGRVARMLGERDLVAGRDVGALCMLRGYNLFTEREAGGLCGRAKFHLRGTDGYLNPGTDQTEPEKKVTHLNGGPNGAGEKIYLNSVK